MISAHEWSENMIPQTSNSYLLLNAKHLRLSALWLRWVLANALGELMGLGLVAVVAGGLIWRFGEPRSTIMVLLFTALMITLGACEGMALGWTQWLAVHPFLHPLQRREWMNATICGAVIAWSLGMIPSTLFSLQETTGNAAPMTMDDTTKYLMAATMGLALGVVLGIPQWMVLRRCVKQARRWIGANAIAWAFGMPIIFLGAGATPTQASGGLIVLMIAITLFVAGAVVGAVHGCVLVHLLQNNHEGKIRCEAIETRITHLEYFCLGFSHSTAKPVGIGPRWWQRKKRKVTAH